MLTLLIIIFCALVVYIINKLGKRVQVLEGLIKDYIAGKEVDTDDIALHSVDSENIQGVDKADTGRSKTS